MTKRIAIMQPTFNPWLGYFDMMDKVDEFIYFDDVQLSKQSWQVRNRILTANGELFLIIPVEKSVHFDELLISSANIHYGRNWVEKHLKNFEAAYRKSQYFKEVYEMLESHYGLNITTLAEFNCSLIESIKNMIGITTKTFRSSAINDITGSKDERLVNICKKQNATMYLSARGSSEYIERLTPGGEFTKNDIELYYHNYCPKNYPQIHSKSFIPYLGVVDLLFNVGFENALEFIRAGRSDDFPYAEFRNRFLKLN